MSGGAAAIRVDDWAFGLVDQNRQPKPAALAVSAAFAAAPFPCSARSAWPRVSVVVCAYNASDTLEECLTSLENLTYPDYEIILVNDGSRDSTSEIGHRHSRVRVIDIPNGGLSAARNVGIAEARGDIVAYTDADVRVDRDWLTYLVQPFLTSDVVGSGGPNVVPPNDPPMAQCIARAPGGPTHVLLDDRIAEHVPGCNMAFRRDALLAIGGFNPTLSACGRRRRCLLAAAGPRLEDRLLLVRTRLAPPSVVRWRVLAAAGRLRRGRELAHGAPSGKVPRRTHAVARSNLQPAAVRQVALGHADQRRRRGARPLSHRSIGPTSIRSRSCRTRSNGRCSRSSWRSPGLVVAATRQHKWAALLLLGAGLVGHSRHDCQERHLRHEVGR